MHIDSYIVANAPFSHLNSCRYRRLRARMPVHTGMSQLRFQVRNRHCRSGVQNPGLPPSAQSSTTRPTYGDQQPHCHGLFTVILILRPRAAAFLPPRVYPKALELLKQLRHPMRLVLSSSISSDNVLYFSFRDRYSAGDVIDPACSISPCTVSQSAWRPWLSH